MMMLYNKNTKFVDVKKITSFAVVNNARYKQGFEACFVDVAVVCKLSVYFIKNL